MTSYSPVSSVSRSPICSCIGRTRVSVVFGGSGFFSRLGLAIGTIEPVIARGVVTVHTRQLQMPHRRVARLRVKRADADRLRSRGVELAAMGVELTADRHRRALAAALPVQQSRVRIRRSMWLAHSA